MSVLHMNLGEHSYDITVERGSLRRIGELLRLDRRVLILTDSGVPAEYAQRVANACREPHVVTLTPGESNKCIEKYTHPYISRTPYSNTFLSNILSPLIKSKLIS